MACLGAPACRMDVWVVGINPEVIAVTPAIKVELGRKGPWQSDIPQGAQLAKRSSKFQQDLPILGAVRRKGPSHCNWSCPMFPTGFLH